MAEPGAQPDGTTGERFLSTAAALFRRKGFRAATTRELAETLGVERPTLYHYMRSKDELLERVCLESLGQLRAAIVAIPSDDPDRLRRTITTHLTVALTDIDLHATMLLEHNALPAESRTRVEERRGAYQDLLQNAVVAGQAAGQLRDDYTPKQLTQALLNLLNWTLFWFDPAGEDSPEELAERYAEIYLRGTERR